MLVEGMHSGHWLIQPCSNCNDNDGPAFLLLHAAGVHVHTEATVVPVVMQGMQAVSKERPENPVEYLAYYLLSHNPNPSPQPKEQPPAAAPPPQP
eukprot:scaffold171016_cov21-Tisochrysis_lutea.AAC.1